MRVCFLCYVLGVIVFVFVRVSITPICLERPSEAEDMTKAVVFVMAGLHAKGFVHLDLKPENLMVFDGALKLIDVGG